MPTRKPTSTKPASARPRTRAAYPVPCCREKQGDRATAKAALPGRGCAVGSSADRFHSLPAAADAAQRTGALRLEETGKAKPFLESFCTAPSPRRRWPSCSARFYAGKDAREDHHRGPEAYLRGYPGDGQALTQLAVAYLTKGRSAKAAQLMQDALKAKDAPEYRTAWACR